MTSTPKHSARWRTICFNSRLQTTFDYAPDAASAPAFVQQRAKLRPEALEALFRRFAATFPNDRLYRGYRLLATDGCDVRIPLNPEDTKTFFPGSNGQKTFNITKISALFDIMSRIYEDALMEGKAVANENKMLVKIFLPLSGSQEVWKRAGKRSIFPPP